MKKTALTFFLSASLSAPYASATDATPQSNIETPVSADITITPYVFSFVTRIDDAILQKVGCRYLTSSPALAGRLLELVSVARDATEPQVSSPPSFEIRNKIVIHFPSSRDITVTFGQQFLTLAYLEGTWNTMPTRFQGSLVNKVHELVKQAHLEQTNKSAPESCD